MELSKKSLERAYNPFFKLARYMCFLYAVYIAMILVSVAVCGVYFLEEKNLYFYMKCIKDLGGVYLILCVSAYILPIFSIFEQKSTNFRTVRLKVVDMQRDGLFGDYKNANDQIRNCYPKNWAVERNKLICIDEKGKRYKLRTIGSAKKMKTIRKWFLIDQREVYITFGRFTKIILFIEYCQPKEKLIYDNVKLLNNLF